MAQDGLFGAPAGWYPDPLGLPQLRWWNNHAWTEQTSAARQPMVMQDTKFAWADDELPTRREERERERQNLRSDRKPNNTVKPSAATLRELEPPRAFTKIDDGIPAEPVAAQPAAAASSIFDAKFDWATESAAPAAAQPADAAPAGYVMPDLFADVAPSAPAAATAAPSFGSLFDTKFDWAATPAAATTPGAPAEESLDSLFGARSEAAPATRVRTSTADHAAANPRASRAGGPLISTPFSWIIAMIPLFQLVLSLLLLTALGMGSNVSIFVAILAIPYLVVIALAYFDRAALIKAGIERPAHWLWALGSAPVYLLARAHAVIRETGRGIGPVLVWFGLGALHLASVVAIPGLLIALLPGVFTTQLESSIENDALLISGAQMSVSCPATPPVLFGEQTICTAMSASGNASEISVSLERANGWIAWQVLDWGVWGIDG